MASNPILTIDGKIVANGSGFVCFRVPSDATPPTVVLSNLPSNPTAATTTDIIVGGDDVVAYKYKLDGGDWSPEEVLAAVPIQLSGLADGAHTISIIGKDSAGNWKSENEATIHTWTIINALILHLDAGNSASYPGTGATWYDISGQGFNGTLLNNVTYNSADGGVMVFNGTNSYVNAGTHSILQNTNNHTVETWVKSYKSGWQFIAGYYEWYSTTYSDYGYALCMISDGKYCVIQGAGTTWNYARSNASHNNDQTWHHLVGVRTNGTSYVYLDGVVQATTTTQSPSFSSPKMFIGWQGSTGQAFGGRISIVRVYNRALSGAEILHNFNATKSRFGL